MVKNTGLFGAITGASFLLVIIGLLTFLYAQSFTESAIFPQDVESWNKILTYYVVTFAIALIGIIALVPKTLRKLATANYWKSFLFKFIPTFLVFSIFLILIKGLLKGADTINVIDAISYIPLSVLVVQIFVITQVEELLFGGLFYTAIQEKYGHFSANTITAITFALFHFATSGGSWVTMLTYAPLRLFFNYVRNNGTPLLNNVPVIGEKFFGATPQTQQANAGFHLAWNFFVLAFIKPFQ